MSKFSQWQVARDRIKILYILGEGQFGNVYKAELKQEGTVPIIVAIKQIKVRPMSEHNIESKLSFPAPKWDKKNPNELCLYSDSDNWLIPG